VLVRNQVLLPFNWLVNNVLVLYACHSPEDTQEAAVMDYMHTATGALVLIAFRWLQVAFELKIVKSTHSNYNVTHMANSTSAMAPHNCEIIGYMIWGHRMELFSRN
jgi:hypothetical protein